MGQRVRVATNDYSVQDSVDGLGLLAVVIKAMCALDISLVMLPVLELESFGQLSRMLFIGE